MERIIIDQYSVAAKPLEMYFGSQILSLGTAFIWRIADQAFLITNKHNLTGRNPVTGKHLSPTAAEPDSIIVHLDVAEHLGTRAGVQLALHDGAGEPLWLEHPNRPEVDVVALPLEQIEDAELHPINEIGEAPMRVSIGIDAFILGFPFGVNVSAFPIWKRASIASEPQVWIAGQPRFYVDTASRPGMSGSPVILRSWGSYTSEEGGLNIGPSISTRFIGIYSGRLGAEDELQAQLGIVWRAELVSQIIEGGQRAASHQ